MFWFIIRSLAVIILSFALGLLVGWLWWRRKKYAFSESNAVQTVTERHSAQLAQRDAELERHSAQLAERDAEIGRLRSLAGTATATGAAASAGRGLHVATPAASSASVEPVVEEEHGALEPEGEADALADVHDHGDHTHSHGDQLEAAAGVPSQGGPQDGETLTGAADAAPAVSDAAPAVSDAAPAVSDAAPLTADAGAGTTAGLVGGGVAAAAAADGNGAVAGDELERIEGIGPRIAAALRAAGIHTFGDLAGSGQERLREALSAAGLSFAPSLPTWSRQARLLADGDEAGFKALTDELVAGRPAAGSTAEAAADGSSAGGTAQGVIDLSAAEAVDAQTDDDLERIEGIGPRIATALRAANIRSFGRLATADVPSLQAALEASGLRFAPSLPTWGRQARLLADGDEAGFIALTDQLVAGRDTSEKA